MAKKSRRARAKLRTVQQTINRGEIRTSEPVTVPKIVRSVTGVSSIEAQASRYQHIVPELLRIGIISGVLFIIIIVLSFIIK
jgi:hypothetical protein